MWCRTRITGIQHTNLPGGGSARRTRDGGYLFWGEFAFLHSGTVHLNAPRIYTILVTARPSSLDSHSSAWVGCQPGGRRLQHRAASRFTAAKRRTALTARRPCFPVYRSGFASPCLDGNAANSSIVTAVSRSPSRIRMSYGGFPQGTDPKPDSRCHSIRDNPCGLYRRFGPGRWPLEARG